MPLRSTAGVAEILGQALPPQRLERSRHEVLPIRALRADRAQRLVHAIGILLGSRGLAGRSAHEGIQQEMDAVIQLLVGDDRRVTDIQLVLQRQHSYVEVVVSALFIATISPSCHSGASASSSRYRCDILSVSGSFAFAL